MSRTVDFGTMNPNSQHQLWSRWTFGLQADVNHLPLVRDVRENARRYFAKGFQSHAGRVRITKPDALEYVIEVEIEGPPAHDPEYRTHVKRQFIEHFMFKGFGYSARLVRFDVKPLAGYLQNGKPAEQWIVMPPLSDLLKGLGKDG